MASKQQDLKSLKKMGGKLAISTLNAPRVASSTYRSQQDKSLVTPSVRDYIYQQNLYNIVEKVVET